MKSKRRSTVVTLLATGMAIGIVMAGTPAGAHVGGTVNHLWNHLRPKTDARYVNLGENPWAVVQANGTLVRGNIVQSSTRVVEGQYEVIFRRNVRTCAYVATLAEPEFTAPAGEIAVASRVGNVNGVFVQTRDSAGTIVDRGFHLAVFCVGAPPVAPRIVPANGTGVNGG